MINVKRSKITFSAIGAIMLMSLSNVTSAKSVNEIIKEYYPIYNKTKQCQGIMANDGSSGGEGTLYQSGYCIEIDRQLEMETKKGKRLYVLVIGDISFNEDGSEAYGAHVFSGLVGMFVLKPQGSGWEVESANPAMNAGASGKGLKGWKLIQVAPDKWGFINIHSDSHWVHSGSAFVLLTPDDSSIRRSWVEAKYEHSNAGSGSAGSCSNPDADTCTLLKAKLGVNEKMIINGFYPLEITLNGFEDDKVYKNQVYMIKYQPRLGYQVPNDYPMKDVSF
ncbi:hypothetical protein [Psychrobacter sp.]|uniref:hypothetical protein n=1 Tax=Psychrobacter sp. TaxID=56811 RepID=UPI002FDA0EB8